MFDFYRQVTYSEISSDQKVSVAQVIRYFQDCSTSQSESLGVGIDYLKTNQKAWILTAWQIIFDRRPHLTEKIRVSTWAHDFDAMYGYRNFTLCDEAGTYLARANSIWVLTDLVTGKPIRLDEGSVAAYEKGESLKMDYASRRIKLPKVWEPQEPLAIRKADLDTNCHVNNARYVELALEYIPEQFAIHQLRAEYKKSAVYGDIIYPQVSLQADKIVVALYDIKGNLFAAVEMLS